SGLCRIVRPSRSARLQYGASLLRCLRCVVAGPSRLRRSRPVGSSHTAESGPATRSWTGLVANRRRKNRQWRHEHHQPNGREDRDAPVRHRPGGRDAVRWRRRVLSDSDVALGYVYAAYYDPILMLHPSQRAMPIIWTHGPNPVPNFPPMPDPRPNDPIFAMGWGPVVYDAGFDFPARLARSSLASISRVSSGII